MEPPSSPFFSILVPVFNAEKYLMRALDSLYRQTFQDFEVLLCDDASTDNSREILQNITDPRFRLFSNKENRGVGKTLEKLRQQARGGWVARLDADDAYADKYLETRQQIIESLPHYDYLYGGIKPLNGSDKVPCCEDPSREISISDTSQGATLIIRTQVLDNLGGFAPLHYGEDYDLFTRAQKAGLKMLLLNDDNYFYYRDNEKSLTQTWAKQFMVA